MYVLYTYEIGEQKPTEDQIHEIAQTYMAKIRLLGSVGEKKKNNKCDILQIWNTKDGTKSVRKNKRGRKKIRT